MVEYAPIAPLPMLKDMKNHGLLGNYLLLLAHDVLENSADYEAYFGYGGSPPFMHIIMDNSTVELDNSPLDASDVLEAAKIVSATCVILPDVQRDHYETIAKVKEALKEYKDSEIPLMAVPQGIDNSEIVKCAQWMHDNVKPDYWGIPRWFTNEIGSRKPHIQLLNALVGDPKIHLLGMSSNLTDDLESCMLPGIMGIDSANPIVMGQANKNMRDDQWVHMDRGDLWEQTTITATTTQNIQYMRKQLEGWPK